MTATVEPTISNNITISNFELTLDKPGDFYEFTVDVVNDGTIDAMIESIEKTPNLTETQQEYLNYIIEYQNGEQITTKQLVKSEAFVRLKVRVEYKEDLTASELPSEDETLNLGFIVNYIQSDGTGSSVKDNGEVKLINVVSGDGTQTSDEVCIGEECFYVMYSEEDTVTMLAKYNLYVGGEYNKGWIAYGSEATGKQDSTMLGYVNGQSVRKGTTVFSSSSQKGKNYCDYNGSIVEGYVNNYNNYLIMQGVTPIESRLITKDELISLGCGESGYIYSCSNAPSWVYSTSYWSGSAFNPNDVWCVLCDGEFSNVDFNNDISFGVRPVIVISKSLF